MGLDQGLMIGSVLLGIGLGETSDGRVEGRSRSQVGGDGDAIARARMGPSQGPTAQLAVDAHAAWLHGGDVDRALVVPELADVEVPGYAVDAVDGHPTEQDVTGRLHQALAL